jgi:hypothetical protein
MEDTIGNLKQEKIMLLAELHMLQGRTLKVPPHFHLFFTHFPRVRHGCTCTSLDSLFIQLHVYANWRK